MATVILTPQDCLGTGLRHQGLVLSPHLKSRRNSNRNSSSSSANPNVNSDDAGRRRRSPPVGVKGGNNPRQVNRGGRIRVGELPSVTTAAKASPKNLVMGQVKILKRGEMLLTTPDLGVDSCSKRKGEDLDLGSTDRLGPDPDLMQKQVVFPELKIVDVIYAGSGTFFASPPPSSVPVPSFLVNNGPATSDLRRLLRLDLD